MKTLVATYFMLIALLAITVLLADFNLGAWQTPLSLLIAAAKTALVAYIFMELNTSSTVVRLTAAAGLLWIFFFYFLSALDIGFRIPMPGSSWL